MSNSSLIISIDQGTTSSRAMIFDESGAALAKSQVELNQIYPKAGWVEQDPVEIAETSIEMAKNALKSIRADAKDIAAIGITNQRETTIIWETNTGKPLYNAIVWQDRRTSEMCNRLAEHGIADELWSRTGLVLDPYFSATKMRWLLDNLPDPNLQKRAENGEIRLGTVDSWLIDQLCRGDTKNARQDIPHLTDVTNASRTMLLNIHDFTWDTELLDIFQIPEPALAEVLPSAGIFAHSHRSIFGKEIPITAVAGDQHAALYGQACFTRGDIKCTYGTGAFILANSGAESHAIFNTAASETSGAPSASGMLFTPAWQIGGSRAYALEGSVFTTGAAVQWLRDGLGVIADAEQTSDMAVLAGENDGVYMVPAFAGLGSPHWDPNARASITGMSQRTDRNHIVRATLESTAYQINDLIQMIDSRLRLSRRDKRNNRIIRADGGQTRNPFLMQFQADISNRPIEVSKIDETTALGAAFMAGRAVGIWRSDRELSELWKCATRYEPNMSDTERGSLIAGWREALRRTKTNYKT